MRLSHLLKRAVGANLCQNVEVGLIFPACSMGEIWWEFPLEIILLPHSGRGSRQLLLSRTDYRVEFQTINNTVLNITS